MVNFKVNLGKGKWYMLPFHALSGLQSGGFRDIYQEGLLQTTLIMQELSLLLEKPDKIGGIIIYFK
jgi:hypothetical protein